MLPRTTEMSRLLVLLFALFVGGVLGCREYGLPAGTSPHRDLNFLDMGDQPKVKAQRGDLLGGPVFLPPEGAIPRGFNPYPHKGDPDAAGLHLKNPWPVGDKKALERGELMFKRFCVPCHDATGEGRGKVIEKGFPPPPSLLTQKVRDWSDGRTYHVVSEGQNIMPSYAAQIQPRDRWAAVRYLRKIQSTHPTPPSSATPSSTASAAPSVPPRPPPAGVATNGGGAGAAIRPSLAPAVTPDSGAPSRPPPSPASGSPPKTNPEPSAPEVR